MGKSENVLKEYCLGKPCTIDFNKSRLFLSKSFIKDEDFYEFEFMSSDDTMKINEKHIVFISSAQDSNCFKVVINYPQTSTGIVKGVENKFLILEITNTKLNKSYENLIPLNSINGIKIFADENDFMNLDDELKLNN